MTDEHRGLSVSPRLKSGDNQGSPDTPPDTTGTAAQTGETARNAVRVSIAPRRCSCGVPLTDRPREAGETAHADRWWWLVRVSREMVSELVLDETQPAVVAGLTQHDDLTVDLHFRRLGFRDLVQVAQRMLDEHYPEDLFGEGSALGNDPGSRFTQHLRAALAALDEEEAPA